MSQTQSIGTNRSRTCTKLCTDDYLDVFELTHSPQKLMLIFQDKFHRVFLRNMFMSICLVGWHSIEASFHSDQYTYAHFKRNFLFRMLIRHICIMNHNEHSKEYSVIREKSNSFSKFHQIEHVQNDLKYPVIK